MEIFNKNPSKAGIRKRAIWTATNKNFPGIKFVLQKLLDSNFKIIPTWPTAVSGQK